MLLPRLFVETLLKKKRPHEKVSLFFISLIFNLVMVFLVLNADLINHLLLYLNAMQMVIENDAKDLV